MHGFILVLWLDLDNGIKNLEDLKSLKEEDFKEIGLNVVEKRRVKDLVSSFQASKRIDRVK